MNDYRENVSAMVEAIHILVVDDNEMNRDMLSRRLKRQEYDVTIAEDGDRALELIHQQHFSLVLLDVMMPTISGYEVLERLKHDPATQHIPVIMISAVDDVDSVVRCIDLGAEDYLFKPFNPVLLKARVEASLRKKNGDRHQQELAAHVQAIAQSVSSLQQMPLPDEAGALVSEIQAHVNALNNFISI
jgi:DNA-binding response OmpR family regulator